MVTDAMLRQAAAEAERFLLTVLPEPGKQPHTFSKSFVKKMDKLTRRVKHPIRYKTMRYAAAVVLAIIMLFGTVFAASPEVRAKVIGWVKEMVGIYAHYTPAQTVPTVQYDYALTGLTEQYTLLQEIPREYGMIYIYRGEEGRLLKFYYLYGRENADIFIDTEGYEVVAATVGTVPAEVYITLDEDKNNLVVWEEETEGVLFVLSANLDKDKLIALAESVQKTEQ